VGGGRLIAALFLQYNMKQRSKDIRILRNSGNKYSYLFFENYSRLSNKKFKKSS